MKEEKKMASFEQVEEVPLNLRVLGFCGADDSIDPELLQLISSRYSWVEWGILFRPDLEGTPRYPSKSWVQHLIKVNMESGQFMRLAAHLCKSRCQEVLDGNTDFVHILAANGFHRFQINATAANGIDMNHSHFATYAANLKKVMESLPDVEFIFQLNDETRGLYNILRQHPPRNMSVLFDASCGKGVEAASYPSPPTHPDIPCGYAGGIGPENLNAILKLVAHAASGKAVWVDMESSLRVAVTDKTIFEQDQFSISKCFQCIKIAVKYGLPVTRTAVLAI